MLREAPRLFSHHHPTSTSRISSGRPHDVPNFQRFLKLCRIVTHSRLHHSLQHCEYSTRCLWCVSRHQPSPDFAPITVRHSLHQSQTSSCGQCGQQSVHCVATRSHEHGRLIKSRWNIRHKLSFFVLQERHALLVLNSEVVFELETELLPSSLVVVIRSRVCSKLQNFCHV